MQFPINNSTILKLKPRLKQYMEIDIKKSNFRWYDDQLRLYSNTDKSFSFIGTMEIIVIALGGVEVIR